MSAPSAVADAPLPPIATAPVARNVILVAEDDPMVAELIGHVLERIHWRVVRAADAAACERLVAQHGPAIALALLDCGLPDARDHELCERVRAMLPGLPVLLMSGSERSGLAQSLTAGGPSAFLPKPFLAVDLVRRVQALMATAAAA